MTPPESYQTHPQKEHLKGQLVWSLQQVSVMKKKEKETAQIRDLRDTSTSYDAWP